MRLLHRAATGLTAAVLVVGTTTTALSGVAQAAGRPDAPAPVAHTQAAVCSGVQAPGYANCNAHIRTDSGVRGHQPLPPGVLPSAQGAGPSTTLGNSGAYDPSYLQSAYNAPSATAGSGRTVAIVDAYDDPYAASDLSSYRSFFHLSPCTTTNGCFRKVNEAGGTIYPQADAGWSEEISLDLDMVSAICPNCHILLVEATSNSLGDLGTAVNEAVKLGANVVSNSYGGSEYFGETTDANTYFNHPGVAVVASSGDNGYGVEFPAAAPTVTAVGGTTLNQATNAGTRNATETAWSGAGSGCSAYVPKPSWQHDAGCSKRAVADVSAVADPNTGVWVYDSAIGGWAVFGGTSVASPIVGSMFALGGSASPSSSQQPASWPYAHPAGLNDVVSGSNGSCGGSYLCTAVAGYDGPTGLGTPSGTAAFTGSGGTTPPPSPPPAPTAPAPTAPGAPQNVQAAGGYGSVNLSWSAPASNGGSALTGYRIYRSTTPGGETYLGSVTGSSLYNTGVSNNTTYYYQVSAVNSIGEGTRSNEVSATPQGPTPLPGSPSLSAVSSSSLGVTLTWTVPAHAGATYQLYRSTRSGWEALYMVQAFTCGATTCTFNDTNTARGVTYYYQVAATNSTGTGARSPQAWARAS